MKKPLQTLLVTSMVLTPTLLSIPMPHSVSAVQAAGTNEKEEKKDPEKMKQEKDKLKEETKKWKEDLPKDQQELLEDLSDKEKQKEINDSVKDKEKKGTKEWKEKIEKLDKALEEAPKTETAITAYIPIKSTKGLEKGDTFSEEGYLVGSDDIPDRGTDFAEVTIPAGESIIALENGDILTRRDSESTITENPVTTVIAGAQVTKLEMTLLAKAKDFKDNVANADTWYKEVYKNYGASLNKEQKAAIQMYTTQNYKTINKGLRENTLPADKEKDVQAISEALAKKPLPETVIAYRKAGKDALGLEISTNFTKPEVITDLKNKLENTTREEKAFLSTSIANHFSESFDVKSVLFKITIPKGTKAGYIFGDLSTFQGESELLIDKGYSYKITKISTYEHTKTTGVKQTNVLVEATLLPKS